ncbi:MAG: hypothetical protein CK548_05055 [Opitutia bacterium]|nr:MAG: hypothetical protein CK548_05055 [Opitutae bacterium]
MLDAGKEWSLSLRGSEREVSFAPFQVYGSRPRIIEIGGSRLGLTAGPIPGSPQLMFGNSSAGTLVWKSFNVHVATGKYGEEKFSALPTLSVALDPNAGFWHLYSGSRLLADHLPLITAKPDNRQFTVKAGAEGAWVFGLVLADGNPLYEDANFNGVDDVFERQKLGALLPAGVEIPSRQQPSQDWKAAQRAKAPHALFVNRPMPNRLVVADSIGPGK